MSTQQPDIRTADHTEQHLEMVGRWYMVNRDGMATLCADREDAEKEAAHTPGSWFARKDPNSLDNAGDKQ